MEMRDAWTADDALTAEILLHTLAVRAQWMQRTSGRASPRIIDRIWKGKPQMGKLGDTAARIAQKKAAHDAKAEEWANRLNAMDKREPEAFAVGDAVVSEREQDLSEMEKDLRQLSNLPFAPSPSPPPKSSPPPPPQPDGGMEAPPDVKRPFHP